MKAAILLAAGASRRMGRQKLLLPWEGMPMVRSIARRLLDAGLDPVVVVTGHDHEAVGKALDGLPVTTVHNDTPDDGMLSSVRCGIEALPDSVEHMVVALGDHPGVSPATLHSLLEDLEESPEIRVPVFQGRRGHPILIHAAFFPEILTSFDEVGLRGLIHGHPEAVREITVDDPGIHLDLDTPEIYRQHQREKPSA